MGSSAVGISGRHEFTHDGVLDEELFLEIVANLLCGHNESGKRKADDETRRDDLVVTGSTWTRKGKIRMQ